MIKKTKKKITPSKGFTLIEVIVTVSILGIISISVISLFTNSINANRRSALKTKAITAAQNKIESIRNEDFANILEYNDQVFSVNEIAGNGKVEILTTDWNENSVLEDYEEELITVKITVWWNQNNKKEEIWLATHIAKNGINKR
jgi:prepilin-type N-terminal cleavage/methylation domain-containing protein